MAITKVTSGLISAEASAIDLNIDANTLYIDASENRVGIGTSSPQVALHVSHATAPSFRLSRTGTGQIYQFGIDSSGRFSISEAASEGGTKHQRFVIDDSGEVGIGTSAPDKKLHVQGSTATGMSADANTLLRLDNNANNSIQINSGTSNLGQIRFGDADSNYRGAVSYNHSDNNLNFVTQGSERMRIDSSGRVGIGTTSPSTSHKLTVIGDTKFTGQLSMSDSQLIKMGDSEDFAFYHDQSIGNIIKSNTSDMDIFIQGNDGGSTITALKLDMSNNGRAVFNAGAGFSDHVNFDDNAKAIFGGGDDLQVYHSGSHSYIENYVGNLVLLNNSDDKDIIFQSDDGSGGIETYFYVDGSGKRVIFEQNTRVTDNFYAAFGSDADLRIFHDGANSYIRQSSGATGNLIIEQDLTDADILFKGDDGGSTITALQLDMSAGGSASFSHDIYLLDNSRVYLGSNSDMEIFHEGSYAMINNTTGHLYVRNNADDSDIIFQTDDGSGGLVSYVTLDGSAALTQFDKDTKHVDSVKATFGNSADLQIYHDGSNSFIQDAGTGGLYMPASGIFMRNAANSAGVAYFVDGGAVTLYYDGTAKLATTSTGVTVTDNLTLGSDSVASSINILGDVFTLDVDSNGNTGGTPNMRFAISGSEKVRIDSSGNVGIGTTPATGVRLDIRNDSTTTLADLRNANSSGYGLYVAGGSSSSQYAFRAADKDNTALFTVKSDGNVDIADGNLVVASGHGISFSATANSLGTMQNELFDDYEEGTWTPTINSNVDALTAVEGFYTKIGRMVYVSFHANVDPTSTGTAIGLAGLPYTVADLVQNSGVEGTSAIFSDSAMFLAFPLSGGTTFAIELDRAMQGTPSPSAAAYRGSFFYPAAT